MSNVVSDTCKSMDKSLHLVEHAIDDASQSRERIIGGLTRQPFTEITRDNPLHLLVDIGNASLRPDAQQRSSSETQQKRRQKTEQQRLPNGRRDLLRFIDVAADKQSIAIG